MHIAETKGFQHEIYFSRCQQPAYCRLHTLRLRLSVLMLYIKRYVAVMYGTLFTQDVQVLTRSQCDTRCTPGVLACMTGAMILLLVTGK